MTYEKIEAVPESIEMREKAFKVIDDNVKRVYDKIKSSIGNCVDEGRLDIKVYIPSESEPCPIYCDIAIKPKKFGPSEEFDNKLEKLFSDEGYGFEVEDVLSEEKSEYYEFRIGKLYTISWRYSNINQVCCVVV